jgi:hypothetical protein
MVTQWTPPDDAFTVPDRDTIANALVALDGNGYLVRHLYPRLIELAGTEQTPTGLVVHITTAVTDYVDRAAPVHGPRASRVGLMKTMYSMIHKYVRIMIPDSEAALNDALDFLADTGIGDGRKETDG